MTSLIEKFGVTPEELKELMRAVTWREADHVYTLEDVVFLAATALGKLMLLRSRIEALESGRSTDRITVAEAVKLSGRSRSTIKRLIKSRRILSEKVAGRRLIDRSSFDCFFQRDLIDVY